MAIVEDRDTKSFLLVDGKEDVDDDEEEEDDDDDNARRCLACDVTS